MFFVQVYGVDLVHLGEGRYVVLEDNLRIPSGISYQIKARGLVEELLPEFGRGTIFCLTTFAAPIGICFAP